MFDNDDATTLIRDAIIEGLPKEFQIRIRSDADSASKPVSDLTSDIRRLQLAGMRVYAAVIW